MDNLSYAYDTGNKLLAVSDAGNGTYGFKDGASNSVEYAYDANGNMTIDDNKGIAHISYNHLNLPTTVNIGQNINYMYAADGTKLRKYVNGINTDYAGNFMYEDGKLQFFNTAEGYVKHTNVSGYEYVYQYKDHLGNVRLSYADTDDNGTIDAATEIIEESNYYPFGLKHKGYNNVISSNGNSTAQKKLYNGKEFQDELGLNWHDYGARNYDAALGRWMNLDDLAGKFYEHSPYHYVNNNPVFFVDPDGNDITISSITDEDGNTTYTVTITGKVVNESGGHPYLNDLTQDQLNDYASRIASALSKAFTGGSEDGKTKWVGVANVTVASDENPLTDTDHAFRIVESGMIPDPNSKGFLEDGVVGSADIGENVIYINRDIVTHKPVDESGKSFGGYASLERTVAHETGHSSNLLHEDAKNIEGHLMHQTRNSKAGWKLTKEDILKIEKSYNDKKLNKGKQKRTRKQKRINKRKKKLGYKIN